MEKVSKVLSIFLCLNLLLSLTVSAPLYLAGFYSMFYSGKINITLDKTVYKPGEKINVTITLQNLEGFPLLDTYLVLEVVQGCEKYENVEEKICNVVYEKVMNLGHFEALEERTVNILIPVFENWKSDVYRLDVYWATALAPITGIPASFYNPHFVAFRIDNPRGLELAKIDSTKTRTAGGLSQRGPGVYEESKYVKIELHVLASQPFEGKIVFKTCEYDDTLCEAGFKKYESIVEYTITCNKEKCDYMFKVPRAEKKTAYSVRMELIDKNGNLHSIYRGRYVVLGENVKIMKVAVNSLELEKDKPSWIRVSLTGPLEPNREFTIAKNVKIKVYIQAEGKEIYSNETIIDEAIINNFEVREFNFVPDANFSSFRVCVEAYLSNGNLADKYCSSAKFVEEVPRKDVKIEDHSSYMFLLIFIFIVVVIIIIMIIRKLKKW